MLAMPTAQLAPTCGNEAAKQLTPGCEAVLCCGAELAWDLF